MFMKKLFNSIVKLQNIEHGRRAFIIANGPSINDYELSKIKKDVIIGMNASTLLQENIGRNHDYYCVSDLRFVRHSEKVRFATELVDKKTVRVFREEIKKVVPDTFGGTTFFVSALGRDGFSFDLRQGFFFGGSTTMLCLQLAYYLGCKKIYLLGVDLRYSSDKMRFYKEKIPQLDDSHISAQIKNIYDAYCFLRDKNTELYVCGEKSYLRPYIPFVTFGSLFP